jgi:hypothetical protein
LIQKIVRVRKARPTMARIVSIVWRGDDRENSAIWRGTAGEVFGRIAS